MAENNLDIKPEAGLAQVREEIGKESIKIRNDLQVKSPVNCQETALKKKD